MKKLTAILFITALCSTACVFSSNRDSSKTAETPPSNNQNASTDKSTGGADSVNQAEKKEETTKSAAKTDCLSLQVKGKIDEKQTFPFDHEPFKGACFVTVHDPAFDDPPLGSEFFIYRDGRQIYKFPNPFNGVTTGCWAEAVSFRDLNDDGLTDVIVAGMCSAKTAPYSENMVYVNRGTEFTTGEEANYTLEKFKKIKEITDFVKNNPEQFFQ